MEEHIKKIMLYFVSRSFVVNSAVAISVASSVVSKPLFRYSWRRREAEFVLKFKELMREMKEIRGYEYVVCMAYE
jgi:hypothetical protein